MKAVRRNTSSRTRRQFALREWNRLRRPAVGERELRAIQRALAKRFGNGVDSPASLARWLADEGAELRHPEVIECDARWREAQIESGAFADYDDRAGAQPMTLKHAETLIRKLEKLRQR